MIHTAYERGDFTQFAAMALSTYQAISESISPGLRFSVLCAEDIPYFSPDESTSGYLGDFFFKTKLPVINAKYAPTLMLYLQQHNVEIIPGPEDPETAVRNGNSNVVLVIDDTYGEDFKLGRPATN